MVASLVRFHLTLPDTATRRDIDDGAVISDVTDVIGDPARLRPLYLIAIADGRSTGPEAWSDWKAALVAELYRRVLVAMETGEVPSRSDVEAKARELEAYEPALAGRAADVLATLPPSYLASATVPDLVDEIRLLVQPPAPGEVRYRIEGQTDGEHAVVTICVADRPGTLARTAGVLALHRISVLSAQAFSTSTGAALERFIVVAPNASEWDGFKRDLEAAYSGRLALESHLERKARDYRVAVQAEPEIRVLQDASPHSTVIEVRSKDILGLLYAITSGLSDLDIDIHVAKIDTLGERVVDSFYVRTLWGTKLDQEQAAEAARAIRYRLARLLSTPG
jgi:[protein-PII] uridylyltransferase